MINKIFLVGAISFAHVASYAQSQNLPRRNADSVTAARSIIVLPPDFDDAQQTEFIDAFGYPGWDLSGIDCNNAFQNNSAVPVFVNIVAQFGHSNMTGLIVKQNFGSTWVNAGFARDGGTTTVVVAPGAIYCPVTNNRGKFSATVTGGARRNQFLAPVELFSEWPINNPTHIYVGRECYEIMGLRVQYGPNHQEINRYYRARYTFTYYMINVSINDARIAQGTCRPPEQPTER